MLDNIHKQPQQPAAHGLWVGHNHGWTLQSDETNIGCEFPLQGFAMHLTVRLRTENPPPNPAPQYTSQNWSQGNREACSCPLCFLLLCPPHPHPSWGGLWLQECDGILANRQPVPRGDRAASGRPASADRATVNTRVCPLYQLLSAAEETVCLLGSREVISSEASPSSMAMGI